MNKFCYRIIFSKALGQLVVVSEVTLAQGKTSGQSRMFAGRNPVAHLTPASARLTRLLTASLMAVGSLIVLPAHADIVADRTAQGNQQPTVLAAANGVTQINIQTPNAQGVSVNAYSQFDVNQQGAVLNNSRTAAPTQLAGWVQGNPWLATGSASVILNQVNSTSPSYLNGYLEVAGQKAQLIIANPTGITCNGCGFINASKLTLTTGTPVLQNGSLEAFRVRDGKIRIDGDGMDGRFVDYVDILARAAELNAGVWTPSLRVVAGNNDVTYQPDQSDGAFVQKVQANSPAPAYAIDVSALGGMYAGKISLLGTEAGIGVRNAGDIGASAGQVTISADGKLENSGQINASHSSGNAPAQLNINTTGKLVNTATGQIASTGQASITGQQILNQGTLFGETKTDITAVAEVTNQGRLGSNGDVSLSANRLVNQGQVNAFGVLKVTTQGNIENRKTGDQDAVLRGQRLQLESQQGGLVNELGTIVQGGTQELAIRAGQVQNVSGGYIGFSRPAPSDTNAGGTPPAETGTPPVAPPVSGGQSGGASEGAGSNSPEPVTPLPDNTPGSILIAGGIENKGGEISSGGNLVISADRLENQGSQIVANQLSVGQGGLNNDGGNLQVTDNLSIDGGRLGNQGGELLIGKKLTSLATTLDNQQGTLQAQQFDLGPVTQLNNREGLIQQTGSETLRLTSQGALDNTAGQLLAAGDMSLQADRLLNDQGGVIQSGGKDQSGNLSIKANEVSNQSDQPEQASYISASGSLDLTAGTFLNAGHALTSSQQAMTLNAGRLSNTGQAQIQAVNRLKLLTEQLVNTGLISSQQGAVEASASRELINQGQINAIQDSLTLTAGSVDNQEGGTLYAGKDTVAEVADELRNAGTLAAAGSTRITAGTVAQAATGLLAAGMQSDGSVAGGDLTVTTAGELRSQGTQLAGNALVLQGQQVNLADSELTQGQSVSLTATAGDVDTSRSTTAAAEDGALRVAATGTYRNEGGLAQGGSLEVKAAGLDNRSGELYQLNGVSGTAQIGISQDLNNEQGQIGLTAQDAEVTAGAQLNNVDGEIIHTGSGRLTVAASDLQGDRGRIQSAGELVLRSERNSLAGATTQANQIDVTAANWDNTGHALLAQQDIGIDAQRITNGADGEIYSQQGNVDLKASEALSNAGSVTASDGTLNLTAGSVDNQEGGTLYAGKDTVAEVAGELRNAGTLAAAGSTRITAGTVAQAATGLLAAGMQSDGSVAGGDLTVTTAGELRSQGTQLAGNALVLQGQQVNLTDSELTQGQSVSLTATAGDVNTSGSRVAANGQLVLSSTGKLINQSGVLEADQFSIAVQAIDNRSGRIQQFGAHDLALNLAGELDNRDKGIIAAQQGALRVQAQSIQNQTGLLSQSGTADSMSLQASQLLDGSGGNIESSGALDISASSVVLDDAYTLANGSLTLTSAEQIRHQNALMVQQGQGDLRLTAGAGFNNAGSQIGGSGNVSIAAASLNNVNGHIQTGETGNLSVSVDGQIDNSHDADLSGATPAKGLRSGGALTVQAGDLKNDSGLIAAGQQLDISLVNDLGSNQDGLIVATGNASLAASHIDNRGGQLLSQLGQTTLTARSNIPAPDQASLDNAGGIIAGHTGVSINAHSLNNQSGQITLAQSDSSGSVVIDTRGGALNNAQGDISGQDISVASGDIDNRGGRISASGKLDLVLPGHQLTNQDSNLAGLS